MKNIQRHSGDSGFTLLEIMLSISILVVITFAATNLVSMSFDMRFELFNASNVTKRMNTAMQRMVMDLEHVFVLDRLDQERNTKDRGMKTIFRIEKFGGDKLSFTTMSHLPYLQNSKESEFIYVVYELKEDKENPGITHLYRGATAFMPDNFDEPIPTELLVKNVKSFSAQPWTGDRWSKDKWDTTSGSTSNKMPRMVMLTVEVYMNDLDNPDDETQNATDVVSTVVYLQRMRDFSELKKGAVNFKWY